MKKSKRYTFHYQSKESKGKHQFLFLRVIFIFFLLEPTFEPIAAVRNPLAVRSIAFEKYMLGQRFVGSVISTFKHANRRQCAFECSKLPHCRSFNLCASKRCEMNSDDEFSVGLNFTMFNDSNCEYWAMSRDHSPECEERGETKDICDDLAPGECNINLKRVDAIFGPWNLKKDIGPLEVRTFKVRETLKPSAHGGLDLPPPIENVLWLKVSAENMTWSEAKSYCELANGQLLSNLLGTKEQLDFIYDSFGLKAYFLGIKAKGQVSSNQWEAIDGTLISPELIIWGTNQPNVSLEYATVVVINGYWRYYLNNGFPFIKRFALCDLINSSYAD